MTTFGPQAWGGRPGTLTADDMLDAWRYAMEAWERHAYPLYIVPVTDFSDTDPYVNFQPTKEKPMQTTGNYPTWGDEKADYLFVTETQTGDTNTIIMSGADIGDAAGRAMAFLPSDETIIYAGRAPLTGSWQRRKILCPVEVVLPDPIPVKEVLNFL